MKILYSVVISFVFCFTAYGQQNFLENVTFGAGIYSMPMKREISNTSYLRSKFGVELGYTLDRSLSINVRLISNINDLYSDRKSFRPFGGKSVSYEVLAKCVGVVYDHTFSIISTSISRRLLTTNWMKSNVVIGPAFIFGYETYLEGIFPSPWIHGGSEIFPGRKEINNFAFISELELEIKLVKSLNFVIGPGGIYDFKKEKLQANLLLFLRLNI